MKQIKIWSLLAMLVVAMTSCGDDKEKQNNSGAGPDEPVSENSIVGDWHLTSWGGNTDIADVYISFDANGTFDLYQKAYNAGYDHYTGRYSLSNGGRLLSGTYSDNVPWATSYACGIDKSGNKLSLLSQNGEEVLSIYTKSTIPDDIEDWVITKAVEQSAARWL